ncbi:limb region 1 protein homolog isoform X3 [Marmota marmota marmota]|nr:limb region 1 protein homolog isoform X3 [Marmota marmota marmota]XP_048641367.1 limb region 1 protein homolog isoform X3 [Marmota marmota marmota]XP_048641368.1 limb region 1 protein homolog isoform X3 [Marmota marmota marmota]
MLLLLALLILGIVWVASALIDNDAASMESLYDLWEFYLPYLYSCISLMGCLLLLLCTPVGLSRMFTVMGQLLVKPAILEDLDEQIYIITLEEEALQRRLNGLSSSVEYNIMDLEQELENVKALKTKLERRKKASAWERNLVYPAVMILLLIETAISVLLVACNILCLLVDETAMPKGARGPGIGSASLSTFGFVGAALEIILIFYLMVSSVVGFYSLRFFGNFTPRKDDTTMTKIIGNCVSILVLSSALPVMSRTLGITRFDLLGDFGRFNWLGNFYIVLSYNLLFAIVTTLCLVRKFTSAVREELFKALAPQQCWKQALSFHFVAKETSPRSPSMDRQQSPVILGSFKNRSKVSGSPVLCSGEAVTGTSSCCCLLVENSVDLADSHDRHARGALQGWLLPGISFLSTASSVPRFSEDGTWGCGPGWKTVTTVICVTLAKGGNPRLSCMVEGGRGLCLCEVV